MKRRLLTLAAVVPVAAAPLLMTAAENETNDLAQPIRVAARAEVITPATQMPADPSDLDIPSFVETDKQTSDATEPAGHAAIRSQVALLEASMAKLDAIPAYTATLVKQERVDGELRDAERTIIKVRHEAFSVYMKWETGSAGQEVLYVDGKYDNQMLVHPGGWKGRFLPTLSVEPGGSLAMSQSRHPVTEAGLKILLQKHIDHRAEDLKTDYCVATTTAVSHEGRPATSLECIYKSQAASPDYSRTVLIIDDATGMPVLSRNFGWTSLDLDGEDATLIEHYEYRDIDLDAGLTKADFKRTNKKYNFK